jgi:hypothetical protein
MGHDSGMAWGAARALDLDKGEEGGTDLVGHGGTAEPVTKGEAGERGEATAGGRTQDPCWSGGGREVG